MLTGDVMYDIVLYACGCAERLASPEMQRWKTGEFALGTVHRAENTDNPARLKSILSALARISREICPVVLPLHPRTRKYIENLGISTDGIVVCEPVSYMDMLLLEHRARMILTDSGGVQKEAYFAGVPCITLRDETEWVETLENGCNTLTGADAERIITAARNAKKAGPWISLYGSGDAGRRIVNELV